jgi:glyoxylase-like metal-dependent hydrolase (beta-lactamase superfamily II)
VRPLECGWLQTDAGGMITGQHGRLRVPVPAFAVEHPRGTLVFDTGMHPELLEHTGRMRETAKLFEVELTDDDLLPARLAGAGIDAAAVTFAAVSHLHFDHCGGLAGVPNARMLVQRAEWDAALEPALVDFGVFNPEDFDCGHDRVLLDGEHDVFGDGAVKLVPTPGHTAGHQSLLIEDRMLLVGDACYCRVALDLDALPPFGADLERQRKTFAWLRRKEAAGVDLVFSHDTAQWERLGDVL